MRLYQYVIFRRPPPWNNFGVVCQSDQATSIISVGSKGHTTLICGLISFGLGSNYSYKFPLRPLCKGEALELFSVDRQLISSQNGDWFFPAIEMQEFVHSLFYLIHVFPNLVDDLSGMKKRMNHTTKWISTQVHDQLLVWVNSQPLAYQWYWEDLLNVKSSSTSWFY
jgi:hypothetical protein